MIIRPFLIATTALAAAQPVYALIPAALPQAAWSYADLADVFASAPVVARVRVTDAVRIKDGAPAGIARFYVEADVVTLIRASSPLPPHIRYLADLTPDSRGKLSKLRKAEFLIGALPGRPGKVRLAARDAQIVWSAPFETRVRGVLAEATAADAPAVVTGVAGAFHVAGTVIGESETQIFLTTADQRPVSLSILRRPNQPPHWSATFGELVDEGAAAPARDTLRWYRLACALPHTLPDAAVGELGADDAAAARVDYAFVIEQLGACSRTRS